VGAVRRPLADSVEVHAPGVAALVAALVSRSPERVRRRVLVAAFDRARDAFNRGDLDVVFALFADDVVYGPPPPLHQGAPIEGKGAVLRFWRDVFTDYDDNAIENLSLVEAAPGSFVRRARLHHRSSATGASLDYVVVQTTELRSGRVVRQVNALEGPAAPS